MKTSKVQSIESMLCNGEAVVQPVTGKSMLPMLNEHTDAVRLIAPDREIEIGDVVMYGCAKNRYILHRVCGIEKNTLIIRGDNCVSLEYVPRKRVVALMDGYIKNGKYIPCDDNSYREYVKTVLNAGKPLIPTEWTYIALLYKAAITESVAPPSPDGIDWDEVIAICERQKISSAVATVIKRINPAPPEDICRRFSESFDFALRRTLLYDAERSRILSELDKKQIRYLPMKAIVIEKLYPKAGMREFADNDILYDKARQKDLIHIMTSLGYKVKSLHDVHDICYKEPIFNFEMHRALFADEVRYAPFFSDILDRSDTDLQKNRMSNEDFYLHFLAHYAGHHGKTGSGLRPLGDLFLLQRYNNGNKDFNRCYVDESLEKLGLTEFEKQILSVCNGLFENGQVDEDNLRLIMSGSAYGSRWNKATAAIRKNGGLGYLLSRVFIPYRLMKTLFPILKTLPFLLPVCWILRIINAIVNRQKRTTAEMELRLITKIKKVRL